MKRDGGGVSLQRKGYPSEYGNPTSALPDILGPLNINQEGDDLVPDNDMAEVAGDWGKGKESRDPLGVIVGRK